MNQVTVSVLKIGVFEYLVYLFYYLFFDLLEDYTVVFTLGCLDLMDELGYYHLRLQQGFIQVGLFYPIAQGVDLLGAYRHCTCYV